MMAKVCVYCIYAINHDLSRKKESQRKTKQLERKTFFKVQINWKNGDVSFLWSPKALRTSSG